MITTNLPSLEEKVYVILEEEILSGKLKRGEQLREAALAERLEASRTPIRGALHRLAEDGLVELCANKGATVIGITREDIEDIYAVRMRLEGLAARLAAERMSDEDKKKLSEVVELSEFYLARGDDKKSGELDSNFHNIIFNASGSRHLCKILCDLHKNIKAYRALSLSNSGRAEKAALEHKDILNAILSKNADEAEKLTSVHIQAALDNFKSKIGKM
ncbi:MAG: GntR family transcriptional regulator [Clostridia bacterium]|nr:GntR family transcriptional regulator [Clostridia bacterium]